MTDQIYLKRVNHAYLQVDCNDRSTLAEMSEFFSFLVPGYQHMPAYKNRLWDGKIKLLDSRTNQIYSGLYDYIHAFANADGRNYEVIDKHEPIYGDPRPKRTVDDTFFGKLNLNGIEPRDYQLAGATHALTNKQSLLVSPTASGKSLVIYMICRYYLEHESNDILIVVPTTSLVEQMASDFANYSENDATFDADSMIYKIYGGSSRSVPSGKRIVLSTWQSIYKQSKTWFSRFGCVIGDEAHNFKAKSLTSILTKCTEADYRIGTTGTLDGSSVHELVLQGVFGPTYYVTTTKDLMDSGSLAKLNVDVLLLQHPDHARKAVKGMKYHEEMEYIVTNDKRNKFIRNLAVAQEGNTLVLFQYVDKHGKPLHDLIRSKADSDRYVFYVSGETDVEAREQVRSITEKQGNAIIVASQGVFSTGVNIRNVHNIIFASPSKSQIRVLQSIGRGLRKSDDGRDTKLYDLADDFQKGKSKNYTLNHAGERIKIYSKEKFNFQIHEVPLDYDE